MNYKEWLAKQSQLQGRDVSQDEQDYDLEGYYNSLKATPADGGGHLPDDFKKPNHPTFSKQSKYHVPVIQEGGEWSEDGEFTPSAHNLKNMGKEGLQRYFNEVENPESLNLTKSDRLSKLRKLMERK